MRKLRNYAMLGLMGLMGTLAIGVTSATSDYMHYQDGTISICDPSSNGTKCITMQDKNLGASKSGTICSSADTGACGNHYQRGNNYGFAHPGNNGSDAITDASTDTKAVRDDSYNNSGYYGTTFIKNTNSPYDYWSDNQVHNGLRGGAEDSASNNRGYDTENNVAYNVTGRQGPCPDGYHIPSAGERGTLLKYWAANYTGAGNTLNLGYVNGLSYFGNYATAGQFHEDFKIPFAGHRSDYDAKVYKLGDNARLWSSSPVVGKHTARYLDLIPEGGAYAYLDNRRADAQSLRCFKDSYLEFPSAASQVAFWTGEVVGEPACSGEVLSGEVVSGDLLTCVSSLSKQYYTLSGWKDVEADAVWTLDTPVTTGLNLQAIWTPDTDSNNNGTADQEESFIITREDGDGNFVWSGEFAYGASPAFGGTQPEKTGHTFSSRDPAVQSVAGDFTYTATWTANEYSITFKDGSGTETDVVWTGNYGDTVTATYPSWTKEGYTGSWDTTIPATVPAENTVITMTWTANEYSITFKDGSGTETDVVRTGNYGDTVTATYPSWTKTGYTGSWDTTIPATVPAENTVITMTWTANEYSITFKDGSGTETDVVWTGNYGTPASGVINYPEWIKTGYTLVWSREIPSTMPAEDIVITGNWTINSYTITFTDPSGENTGVVWTGEYGTSTSGEVNYPSWTRNGYTLSWSGSIPETVPAEDTVITAIWTKKQSSGGGGGGGGGGGSSRTKDNCPNGDYSDSYYDGTCGKNPNNMSSGTEGERSIDDNKDSSHTQNDEEYELQTAYEWAYKNGITTMDTIQKADLDGNLTRIAMAKMLSQYAINVLGKKPANTIVPKFSDITDELNAEYDYGVSLAYQLGIMGINMPENKFRPFDKVTRSEFVTALSRMKYGTPDGKDVYYSTHMELLEKLGIITNTNPSMLELRGYVMLMLMRSTSK